MQYIKEKLISLGWSDDFKKYLKLNHVHYKEDKDSDLVICCDSAPLHIAQALQKNILAVFTTTNPEIVLNSGSKINLYNR